MAKTLSQRIAERAKTKLPSKSGKNRAAFLAVRDEVRQSLIDGWPVKSIWETLFDEGKVAFRLAGVNYLGRPASTILAGWGAGNFLMV